MSMHLNTHLTWRRVTSTCIAHKTACLLLSCSTVVIRVNIHLQLYDLTEKVEVPCESYFMGGTFFTEWLQSKLEKEGFEVKSLY